MSQLQIALIITAGIFAIISGICIYIYTANKRKEIISKNASIDLNPNSWKGWWGNYKWAFLIYVGIACSIISIGLFASAFGL